MSRGAPKLRLRYSAFLFASLSLLLLAPSTAHAGPYVTDPSGIRWNDVGGIRWNDVGGIRWNDVGGIRWNDVGGIRWNDVGGLFSSDALGIRWNDVGGIRWNDVGGLVFDEPTPVSIDLSLLNTLSFLPDSSSVNVIVTYEGPPVAFDFADLVAIGITGGEIFHALPMVAVNATKSQIQAITGFPRVRSVYANKSLGLLDRESADLIGVGEMATDPDHRLPGGTIPTGSGVTIAVIDTGVDGNHSDLPYATKMAENVRLTGFPAPPSQGFLHAPFVEGVPNTDLVAGHGSAVASVAAGTGAASNGLQAGIAPGARILGLSVGDFLLLHVLEGLDYVLANSARFGVRVVNCSWGTDGWFDPKDPVNIATRMLYDAGITVVFAAGNTGPAPDTLNPYSVAPWVIGVGSTRKDAKLSEFSSRGIYEELLYHPRLVAPGEEIVAARAGTLDPGTSPYTVQSGTSFAAPHIAGIVALMLEANPALGPAEINRILQRTATPVAAHDRSEVGAGLVDAWAAVQAAFHPELPFGTHVPAMLDARPYRIDHGPAREDRYTLPAQGTLSIPVVPGTNDAWSADLAWGSAGIADLDVRLLDSAGSEIDRSDSLSGAGLFGRAEGIRFLGVVPEGMTLEVSFKQGTGVQSQDFSLYQEASVAVLTGFQDVADLAPHDLDAVTRAVRYGLMTGKDLFAPWAALSRGDLARSLALATGLPQRIPRTVSFRDVAPDDPSFPYVESVAGARARRILMGPPAATDPRPRRLAVRPAPSSTTPAAFNPGGPVRRIDFAVALVRAAGKQAEAESRAGARLPVADARRILPALAGYVAVALEHGFLETLQSGDRAFFAPEWSISRVEASHRLLELRRTAH